MNGKGTGPEQHTSPGAHGPVGEKDTCVAHSDTVCTSCVAGERLRGRGSGRANRGSNLHAEGRVGVSRDGGTRGTGSMVQAEPGTS